MFTESASEGAADLAPSGTERSGSKSNRMESEARRTWDPGQQGSVLVAAVVVWAVISLFVMCYLSFIEQQNRLRTHSQTWNMAIAVSEAGIEDGLAHLNANSSHLGTDGWAYDGSTCYWRSNTISDGSSYVAYIFTTNSVKPVVVARSYVMPPPEAQNSKASTPAVRGAKPRLAQVSRTIQVTCSKENPSRAVPVARRTSHRNGYNAMTRSYDYSDAAKSTDGLQGPEAHANYGGDAGYLVTGCNEIK